MPIFSMSRQLSLMRRHTVPGLAARGVAAARFLAPDGCRCTGETPEVLPLPRGIWPLQSLPGPQNLWPDRCLDVAVTKAHLENLIGKHGLRLAVTDAGRVDLDQMAGGLVETHRGAIAFEDDLLADLCCFDREPRVAAEIGSASDGVGGAWQELATAGESTQRRLGLAVAQVLVVTHGFHLGLVVVEFLGFHRARSRGA